MLPCAHECFLGGLAVLRSRHSGAKWVNFDQDCSSVLDIMANCVECLWAVGCDRSGLPLDSTWELIERMYEFKLLGPDGPGPALEVSGVRVKGL